MRSASAIGLAIRAPFDSDLPGQLQDDVQDQFNRTLACGAKPTARTIFFDLIFPVRTTAGAGEPPLRIEAFIAAHNIATSAISNVHNSTSTCSLRVKSPTGPDSIPLRSPTAAPSRSGVCAVAMLSSPDDQRIREIYVDSTGSLRVRIHAEPAGYTREFTISQSRSAATGSHPQLLSSPCGYEYCCGAVTCNPSPRF